MFWRILSVLIAVLVCEGVPLLSGDEGSRWDALPAGAPEAAEHRELRVLTYNVAGLPDLISQARPGRDSARIGALLAGYELVLLQESFWYHDVIAEAAALPFGSAPAHGRPRLFGDGLARLGVLPMGPCRRVRWRRCSGVLAGLNDCLARKGASLAVHRALGEKLWVVNLHLDAGQGPNDRAARAAQLSQLAAELRVLGDSAALLVAGDFNLRPGDPHDRALYEDFLKRTGLQDVAFTLGVAEDELDRVAVRSGRRLALAPLDWTRAEEFCTSTGEALSDHPAIAVRLHLQRQRPSQQEVTVPD